MQIPSPKSSVIRTVDKTTINHVFFRLLVLPWLGSFLFLAAGCGGDNKKAPDSEGGEAKVGVGKKGEGYGNNVPILKPAATFWKAKEKIAFEIAIPKAMQLYEALNGRKPKSHQEFMDEIISKNRIKLPELKEGLEYFYDAKQGILMARNQAAKQ